MQFTQGDIQQLSTWFGPHQPSSGVNLLSYGADRGIMGRDGEILPGDQDILSCATAKFKNADEGKWIAIYRVGPQGGLAPWITTIVERISATQIRLADPTPFVRQLRRFAYAADSSDAFDEALAVLERQGGGQLFVPAGHYFYDGLELPSTATIVGEGHHASLLVAKHDIGRPMIRNTIVPGDGGDDTLAINAMYTGVSRVGLIGNQPHQTVNPDDCHGIQFSMTPSFAYAKRDYEYDPSHRVSDVWVMHVKAHGVYSQSRSGTMITNVSVWGSGQNNFRGAVDTSFIGCLSGRAGDEGFWIGSPNVLMSGCFSFYSGQNYQAAIETDPEDPGIPNRGFGFRVINIGDSGRVELIDCSAQDNWAAGFMIEQAQGVTVEQCVADSNSKGEPETYAGFELWNATNCSISGHAFERFGDPDAPVIPPGTPWLPDGALYTQRYAVGIRQNSHGNTIRITHGTGAFVEPNMEYDPVAGTGIDSSASINRSGSPVDTIEGNDIIINVQRGAQRLHSPPTPAIDHADIDTTEGELLAGTYQYSITAAVISRYKKSLVEIEGTVSADVEVIVPSDNSSVTLYWPTVTSDDGFEFTDYRLYRDGELLTNVQGSGQSIADTGFVEYLDYGRIDPTPGLTPPAAITCTPEVYDGGYVDLGPIETDIPVAAPRYRHLGNELTFTWKSSGSGGWAPEFDDDHYITNGVPDISAGRSNSLSFRFDGLKWQQIARRGYEISVDNVSKYHGLNVSTPLATLHLQGLILQQSSSFEGNTQRMRWIGRAFDFDQGEWMLVNGVAGVNNNDVNIGGNDTSYDAATRVRVWTAAALDTLTGTQRSEWDAFGNLVHGTAALATSATDGYVYLAAMPGAASGVPRSYTGRVPLAIDSTGSKIGIYTSGSWKWLTASTGGGSVAWGDISGVPSTFPPDAHTQAWSTITSTPTTLAGYGITDAAPLVHTHPWSDITSTPTTVAGYGITDAVDMSSTQAAIGGAKTFTGGVSMVSTAGTVLDVTGASTNAALGPMVLRAHSTGTPTTGFGSLIRFQADTNGGTNQNQALITSRWENGVDATRRGYLEFRVYDVATQITPIYAGAHAGGSIRIGGLAPDARLHLPAGTATAGTAPLKFTSGTFLTTAEAGTMNYNGRFALTESDTTRRYIVQAAAATKVTAAAPYTNTGYVTITINGTDYNVLVV